MACVQCGDHRLRSGPGGVKVIHGDGVAVGVEEAVPPLFEVPSSTSMGQATETCVRFNASNFSKNFLRQAKSLSFLP